MSPVVSIPKDFVVSLNKLKKNDADSWEKKYRIATKRLLSSIFFFVSARNCYASGNKILSAMGFYYSMFHMSKALLFLLPYYTIDQLEGANHKKVYNLVQTYFVQKKILSQEYSITLEYYRQIREGVNYGMDTWISLSKILKENEPKLLSCLDEAISVFKEICRDNAGHICTIIGDGIGDDWMDSYLSKKEAQQASDILIRHNLTT